MFGYRFAVNLSPCVEDVGKDEGNDERHEGHCGEGEGTGTAIFDAEGTLRVGG